MTAEAAPADGAAIPVDVERRLEALEQASRRRTAELQTLAGVVPAAIARRRIVASLWRHVGELDRAEARRRVAAVAGGRARSLVRRSRRDPSR